MVLQYIDSEISSDTSDISDTPVKADQNKVTLSVSDTSDTPVKTGPNKVASFTFDISDISDYHQVTSKCWPMLQLMNKIIMTHLTNLTHLTIIRYRPTVSCCYQTIWVTEKIRFTLT